MKPTSNEGIFFCCLLRLRFGSTEPASSEEEEKEASKISEEHFKGLVQSLGCHKAQVASKCLRSLGERVSCSEDRPSNDRSGCSPGHLHHQGAFTVGFSGAVENHTLEACW